MIITWMHTQGITIKEACTFFDMPTSTYYSIQKRGGETKREKKDRIILQMILAISRYTNFLYGYRRMKLAILKYFNIDVGVKTVRRIMQVHGIRSNYRYKPRRKAKTSKPQALANNLLNRDFVATEPYQKWSSDVTEFHLGNKVFYLCLVLDLYCNYPIGWAISTHNNTALVLAALKNAGIEQHPPKILHTDRGSNYTSRIVQDFLKALGVEASMSRPGTPLDNAVEESINGVLKSLMEVLRGKAETPEQLLDNIIWTINFYKRELVTDRFGIRSLEEIFNVALKILKARAHGEVTGEIKVFSIPKNTKIEKFWETILSCPKSEVDFHTREYLKTLQTKAA